MEMCDILALIDKLAQAGVRRFKTPEVEIEFKGVKNDTTTGSGVTPLEDLFYHEGR